MSNIKKAIKGDKEAFIEVIEEYKVIMYKTAKAILRNEDDACDAIQESLINIYENIHTLKNEKYFKTWMTRIVINQCYHLVYKQRLNKEKIAKIEAQALAFEDEYVLNLDKTEMEKALNDLEEELRLVIVMYYYNGFATKDIAKVLEIPKGTVQSRLQRSREKLYNMLTQEEVYDNEHI